MPPPQRPLWTPAEKAILQWDCRGLSLNQIARNLNLSPPTVNRILSAIQIKRNERARKNYHPQSMNRRARQWLQKPALLARPGEQLLVYIQKLKIHAHNWLAELSHSPEPNSLTFPLGPFTWNEQIYITRSYRHFPTRKEKLLFNSHIIQTYKNTA